jgi:hypothetical protein
MTLDSGVVDDLAIVRSICRHRRNVSADLIKEGRHFGDVADIVQRQFHCDNLMSVAVDTEMQLAPTPARADAVFLIEPFALAVNLQTRAVDQEVQRLGAVNSLRQDCQAATAAAQCGVIGDGDVDLEHVGDRLQQTLGLSQRLVNTSRSARLVSMASAE